MGRVVFHITTQAEWDAAQATGTYTADSLAAEGFIHLSESHQFVWVANMRFRGRTDLVLLHIDEARLVADPAVVVKRENLEGGKWLFPHVYGPIPVEAVLGITPMTPASDGLFDHLASAASRFA